MTRQQSLMYNIKDKFFVRWGCNIFEYALIDGKMMAHRQFNAHKNLVTKVEKETLPTGMLFGTLRTLISIHKEFGVRKFIFMHEPTETFRHRKYPEYKSNRTKMTDESFTDQYYETIGVLAMLGVNQIITDDYEADDLIATWCERLAERMVLIISSDKDLYPLLNKTTFMLRHQPKKEFLSAIDIYKKFDILPEQHPLFLALTGDKSDNIIGIDGIGPVGATKIVKKHTTWPRIAKSLGVKNAKIFRRNLSIIKLISDIKTSEMGQLQKYVNMTEFWSVMKALKFISLTREKEKTILELIHEQNKGPIF